jgi:hypothetical protein
MYCELMLTYDTPAYMFNVYKNQPSQQTGSRNLMGPKTIITIWGTYMKLVTKYQIPVINSCWEKCDEKFAYILNVYKSQLSWQTGSRNLTDQKTLPTKWGTYMKLVTKYQISAINICWEKMRIYGSQKCFPQYGIPIWSLWPNTLYQIPVINICWEKCDEKCAYMLNVYKSQLSRQTGSRNLTGQKKLPTKWGNYMKLVTK